MDPRPAAPGRHRPLLAALLLLAACVPAGHRPTLARAVTPSTTTSTSTTLAPTTTAPVRVLAARTKATTPKALVRRPAMKAHPSILAAAQAAVGYPEHEFDADAGFDGTGFWCAKFVSYVLSHAGIPWHDDTPGHLTDFPESPSPAPGDLLLIDLDPASDHGYIGHAAIVERVTADGYDTIEGNGPDAARVARWHRVPSEVVSIRRA